MPRNRLYFFLLALSFTGIIWLLVNRYISPDIPVCLFRKITGIPCPSCGITGTIGWLFGDTTHFHFFNILGIILLPLIIIIPVWIIADLVFGRETFYNSYLRMENILRKRYIAIPAILLLILNWIWNIYRNF